ncbi:S1 family peptidase [Solwaraspora sp. WMMD792]|uniref:S1 family peptidase n=1 Tax=Solwaraspora sp. WMMD792 TaxID=3016099 RepID=UPI002416A49F|nr:S1 family peptidase [Solwaraspora sp. WMMD792]MDG4770091.1 S1 family peptidase [Solwaraspora sp. WMMD792]
MRRRHVSLAMAAVLTGALLATVEPVSAEPLQADRPAPAVGRLAAGPAVDPAAASLAADRGIGLAEATRRIRWQHDASSLAAEAATALGRDTFGGMWFGADDDRIKIGYVAAGAAAGSARAADVADTVDAVAAGHDLADVTDTVPVRHSLADLLAANDWIGDRLEQVDQNAKWPMKGSYRTDGNVVRLGVPAPDDRTAAQQALVDEAKRRYGSMLDIYPYTDRPVTSACSFPYCDPPLRAGVRIDPAGCTLGFLARSRSNNLLYAFTAGHCVDDRPSGTVYYTRFPNNEIHNIGPAHNEVFGLDGDAAIIRVVNETGWQSRGLVYVLASAANGGAAGTTYYPDYPISADGGSSMNMRVCKSGAVGGTSCGLVTDLGVTVTYTDEGVTVRHLGEANYCTSRGDSGGPIYAQRTAYGLVSGRSSGTSPCVSFYQGIRGAENLLNVNVVFE